MELKETTLRKLTPAEGHVLTQGGDVELSARVFSATVYLAINDSPDNWVEITQGQADAMKARQQAEHRAKAEAEERARKKAELEAQLAELNDGNE